MSVKNTENSITIAHVANMNISVLHGFSPTLVKKWSNLAFRMNSILSHWRFTLLCSFLFMANLGKHPLKILYFVKINNSYIPINLISLSYVYSLFDLYILILMMNLFSSIRNSKTCRIKYRLNPK